MAYILGMLAGRTSRDCATSLIPALPAKTLIVPALDDLEEEALVEDVGVDLGELAVALAVVEDVTGA
jgi:hypothetical protein